ncbi:MAG: hypothetical protein A2423_00180 [Candidatus Levybacteria bacterium RIFOXYC1_FULL_40_10]|nr:MAG: hypothetical protein A2423_00180 [Candidatus Levybacteria bacterium RIFOXYC1_FULL_40_10]
MLGQSPETDRSRADDEFARAFRASLDRDPKKPLPPSVARPTPNYLQGEIPTELSVVRLPPLPPEHSPNVFYSLGEFLGHEPRDIVRQREAQKQDQTSRRGLVTNIRLAASSLFAGIGH